MNLIEITIFELIKGVVIGVMASAPMGPVGVLCLQRTINKGRWYGFVTGLGAALSDILYALLTGYGMSFMDEFITRNQFALQLFGSALLLLFGFYTFRTDPIRSFRHIDTNNKRSNGTYFNNFITGFLVTLSNPLIIFLFIGLFARFSFISSEIPVLVQLFGYLAIVAGAVIWWFLLSYGVSKIRTQFNVHGVWMMNRVIGVVVMIVSLVGIVLTCTGTTIY